MARILVVEDHEANVEILQRLLTRNRHEVFVAGTRDGAIEMIQTGEYDLVLMDITIPNTEGETENIYGGHEATQWIKSNPATQSIPVIATSAHAMPDDKKRCREAGCDDIVSKPYDFPVLIQTIDRWLNPPG